MKGSAPARKPLQSQSNVHKLITPEMRRQVVQLKRRLDAYADAISEVVSNLNDAKEGIPKAIRLADCLLTDDPFETWDSIRKADAKLQIGEDLDESDSL